MGKSGVCKRLKKTQINANPDKRELKTDEEIHKRLNKNAIKGIDLNQAAYQYFNGADLMKIEGLSHSTILTIMSEIRPDGFSKFESAKDLTNWLRLAPNNKITGGKIIAKRYPKEVIDLKLH